MRRRVVRLAVALAVGFAVLLVQLTNVGFISADALRGHELNTRAAALAVGNPRGAVSSADGETLAPALSADRGSARTLRTYPHGALYAHVVGHLGATSGASGVERSYDEELSGSAADIAVQQLADLFVDSGRVGDLVLTVHHTVQLTARAALGDRDGAVVVVTPASGAVMAMWSRPSFDPNAQVASGPGPGHAGRTAALARTYRRHYSLSAEGSARTAPAGLLSGASRAPGSTGIDLPGEPDGVKSRDAGGGSVGSGQAPLTPLQLVLAAAAVANEGVRMRPYVVASVTARPAGHTAATQAAASGASAATAPLEAGRLFSADEAAALLARMTADARRASVSVEHPAGGEVAAAVARGHFGGAGEAGGGWAVLLAPAEAPAVAVAALVEPDDGLGVATRQSGGTLATAIAATTAEAALALRTELGPGPGSS